MSTGVIVSIATIGGGIILCVIIAWFVMGSMKKQAYEGQVIKKTTGEIEGASDFSTTVYALVVKTTQGETKNIKVGKKIWDQFNEGDKIIKEKGKFNPVKG